MKISEDSYLKENLSESERDRSFLKKHITRRQISEESIGISERETF